MPKDFNLDKFSLKKRNLAKYNGIQPSWKLVMEVIKKSGLKSRMNFQRAWGIPGQMLNQYKCGERDIPPQYWHIFYEWDAMVSILKKKLNEKGRESLFGTLEEVPEAPKPTKKEVLNKNLIDAQIKF